MNSIISSISLKKDRGYWLTEYGELIECDFQSHDKAISEYFNLPYKEDSYLIYNRIAFSKKFIRISQFENSTNIHLLSPANLYQKKVLEDIFSENNNLITVTYRYETKEIYNRIDFLKYINGEVEENSNLVCN